MTNGAFSGSNLLPTNLSVLCDSRTLDSVATVHFNRHNLDYVLLVSLISNEALGLNELMTFAGTTSFTACRSTLIN
jgi:hypothetical protein